MSLRAAEKDDAIDLAPLRNDIRRLQRTVYKATKAASAAATSTVSGEVGSVPSSPPA